MVLFLLTTSLLLLCLVINYYYIISDYFGKRLVVILFLQWATDVAGLPREICAVSVCSLPLGNVEGFFS